MTDYYYNLYDKTRKLLVKTLMQLLQKELDFFLPLVDGKMQFDFHEIPFKDILMELYSLDSGNAINTIDFFQVFTDDNGLIDTIIINEQVTHI